MEALSLGRLEDGFVDEVVVFSVSCAGELSTAWCCIATTGGFVTVTAAR
jgi:hypothetical protein